MLSALLDRLRGRTEWAVKVHAADGAANATAPTATLPTPVPARARVGGLPQPGQRTAA
ncbi:hypothetical protein LV779_26255 [Streptomyces thinghirensis]|nr:hypothetical protein [Streptomyces thinghirensis]